MTVPSILITLQTALVFLTFKSTPKTFCFLSGVLLSVISFLKQNLKLKILPFFSNTGFDLVQSLYLLKYFKSPLFNFTIKYAQSLFEYNLSLT